MSDELGIMISNIATRYATKPNFSGYSYKDIMISSAIYRMIDQIDKIDLDHPKCNPFCYLTMACHNVFIYIIKKEKKYQETKEALKEKYFDDLESEENIHFKKNNDND